MILFGDLRASSTLGTRRGVTVKASEHLYFSNDQLAVMGTERFDLNNHNLGNNSTAGAIVGLVGGA
jgi:HK97 family phage major capsid protein